MEKSDFRVIIAGGRDFDDYVKLVKMCNSILRYKVNSHRIAGQLISLARICNHHHSFNIGFNNKTSVTDGRTENFIIINDCLQYKEGGRHPPPFFSLLISPTN